MANIVMIYCTVIYWVYYSRKHQNPGEKGSRLHSGWKTGLAFSSAPVTQAGNAYAVQQFNLGNYRLTGQVVNPIFSNLHMHIFWDNVGPFG